jgi:hypothetical protein
MMVWQKPEKMAFCLPAPSNTSDMSCMMAPVAAAAEMLSRHPMATYELRHQQRPARTAHRISM